MKKKVLAVTAVALLVQGAISLEAKAARMPEGEKTNVKAPNMSAVSGRVTNEQGEALPGVVVRCGNVNVQTDINGELAQSCLLWRHLPSTRHCVIFSSVLYSVCFSPYL